MIQAKEYFERYIAWKKRSADKGGQTQFESYTAMDLNTLIHEADYNIPGALEELGERYLFGLNVTKDVDRACELFQQAAEVGHPDALHMLADVCRTDQHGVKNLGAYFSLLTAAANRGSWKSMFNLACAYYQGKFAYEGYGFDVDHAAAFQWCMKSIEMSKELLTLFFTNPCTNELKDYFGDVYDTYVKGISVASKQLFDGDGTEQSLDASYQLVSQAQAFHKQYLGSECGKFTAILRHLDAERANAE